MIQYMAILVFSTGAIFMSDGYPKEKCFEVLKKLERAAQDSGNIERADCYAVVMGNPDMIGVMLAPVGIAESQIQKGN